MQIRMAGGDLGDLVMCNDFRYRLKVDTYVRGGSTHNNYFVDPSPMSITTKCIDRLPCKPCDNSLWDGHYKKELCQAFMLHMCILMLSVSRIPIHHIHVIAAT